MKKIVILGGLSIIVVLGVSLFLPSTMTVNNSEPERVVETVTVDTLEVRIKEAQESAKSDVEAKARAAYEAQVDKEMTIISDRIKAEYIAEIEKTITDESY